MEKRETQQFPKGKEQTIQVPTPVPVSLPPPTPAKADSRSLCFVGHGMEPS